MRHLTVTPAEVPGSTAPHRKGKRLMLLPKPPGGPRHEAGVTGLGQRTKGEP
jgi:hypothetical protein